MFSTQRLTFSLLLMILAITLAPLATGHAVTTLGVDVNLNPTDVSIDPGHQVEYGSSTTIGEFGQLYIPIEFGKQVLYEATNTAATLHLDDFIVRVYAPDGELRWYIDGPAGESWAPGHAGSTHSNLGVGQSRSMLSAANGTLRTVPDPTVNAFLTGSWPWIYAEYPTQGSWQWDRYNRHAGVEVSLRDEADFEITTRGFVSRAYLRIRDIDADARGGGADQTPHGQEAAPRYLRIFPGDSIYIEIPAGSFENADWADVRKADADRANYTIGSNKRIAKVYAFVDTEPGDPNVVLLEPADTESGSTVVTTNRPDPGVSGPFQVEVILSEKPKSFTTSHIAATNATVNSLDFVEAFKDAAFLHPQSPYPIEDFSTFDFPPGTSNNSTYRDFFDDPPAQTLLFERLAAGQNISNFYTSLSRYYYGRAGGYGTGRDDRLYRYIVTLTPTLTSTDDIVITIKPFEDRTLPVPNVYEGPVERQIYYETVNLADSKMRYFYIDNPDTLTLSVNPNAVNAPANPLTTTKGVLDADPLLQALPKQTVIPANGYLVLAYGPNTIADTGIVHSPDKPGDKKTDAQKLYHIQYDFDLTFPAEDLATFFRNGGTLQLLYADIPGNNTGANGDRGYSGASARTIAPGDVIINEIMWGRDRGSTDSQYIELHNTTSTAIGIDENEWAISIGAASDAARAAYTVVDTVSNADPYWLVPGSNGATVAAVGYELTEVVSMSRIGDNGSVAASWAASERPSVNLQGFRIGSPGAANNPPMPEPPPPVSTETPVAAAGDIMISEIMVDTNGGRLPQWIELANVNSGPVVLNGWSVSIVNPPGDPAGVSNIPLDGLEVPADQVLLIVSGEGRQSAQHINADRVVNADRALMNESNFRVTLLPPAGEGDIAGNFSEGPDTWELPKAETGRSSLERRGESGTDPDGWKLSRISPLAYVVTFYGAANDIGTPGRHGVGGALPVELSMFTAWRDRLTGEIELRWETASELNNAGFHIQRSETRNGTFTQITSTLIPGAGTTSEKQTYTYADTSAKPNAVYYYQIEEVTLNGERQVLTTPHRLKGHLTAAGKATLIWGALKARD